MASGMQEEYVHKNRLQQLSSRLFAQIPVFETPNEGSQHEPKFRPAVVVDGTRFISPLTFNRRKDAEQYVSKIALEHLFTKLKKEGLSQINTTSIYCKSILHEYAIKKKIALPIYTTSNVEGMLPKFKTSINFDGNTFQGSFSRNKKDAEQLGARSVIQWILDQPDDKSTAIAEIIKTKYKLFKETHGGINSALPDENNPPLQIIVNDHPSGTANKEKDMSNAFSNTQDIHVPLKVATIDNSGDNVGKVMSKETIVSLPVPHANSMPMQVHVDAHTGNSTGYAVVNPIPPALEESKEKLMAIELPAKVYGGLDAVLKPNKPVVDSVSKSINPVPGNPCLEKTVKIKVEEPFEVNPSTVNSLTPGKRSCKKNKRGNAKKTRMDE